MAWKKCSYLRYRALRADAPKALAGYGFLAGEPVDWNGPGSALRYLAFAENPRGHFLESVEPMTYDQFMTLCTADIKVT